MPNHFHGILFICNDGVETPRCGVSNGRKNINEMAETPHRGDRRETPHRGVSMRGGHNSEWKPNSLGSIINQFKSVCTKRIRKINPDFKWQSRYYDRIVRNEHELDRIRQYIYNNPYKWGMDRNNTENLFI